jgi:hypothetical protein
MLGHLLIHARPHRGVTHDDEKYMLFMRRNTALELVEHPELIVQNGVWHSDGLELAPQSIRVVRESSRHDEKEYECAITRTRNFIRIRGIGDVYVYGITNPNKVLTSKYYHVCKGEDVRKAWHFCKRDVAFPALPVALPVAPPVTEPVAAPTAKIPQHIFRCFVDAAIEKKEECPITMEPLTRDTVAATSCGHLFDREAIGRVLRDSGRCPTCRCEVAAENLQTY